MCEKTKTPVTSDIPLTALFLLSICKITKAIEKTYVIPLYNELSNMFVIFRDLFTLAFCETSKGLPVHIKRHNML